jgi:hypothetical protein
VDLEAHSGTIREHRLRVNGEACNRTLRRQIGAMSSLRLPQSLSKRLGAESGEAALRYELLEEQAAALGRIGRKLEAALAALRAHDAEGGKGGRAAALKAATDAAWCFFVQREVMGLRDRAAIVAQYDIPREVMVRIGAR